MKTKDAEFPFYEILSELINRMDEMLKGLGATYRKVAYISKVIRAQEKKRS